MLEGETISWTHKKWKVAKLNRPGNCEVVK